MALKVQAVPVYVNNVKLGELTDVDITFMTNGEQIPTIDEVMQTKGVVTTEASFGSAVPAAGRSLDVVSLVVDQVDVTLGFAADGRYWSIDGVLVSENIKSTVKSGSTTGTTKFQGGKPIAQT